MSTPTDDDSIDRLLRQWAEAQQPDVGHMDELRSQVLDTLDDTLALEQVSTAATGVAAMRSRLEHRWPLLKSCFAVTAILLVTLTVRFLFLDSAVPKPGPVDDESATLGSLESKDVRSRGLLFREFDDLYDGRVLWIVEVNDDIEVGLSENPQNVTAGRPAVVQLVLMARNETDQKWILQERVDLLVRTDEVVDVFLANHRIKRLTMWIHRLPDGGLVVDTNLDAAVLGQDELRTSNVFSTNVARIIAHRESDGQQWQVTQAVVMAP